jgi:tRNA(Ile)-lysidine synthase
MQALSPLQGAPGILLGRPFLTLVPAQLRQALKARRQAWREDRSNRDTKLARNRIRHEVLPVLTSINWTAVEHIAFFARDLGKPKAEDLSGLLQLDRRARVRASALLERGHGQADLGRGWTLRISEGQRLVERAAPASLALKPGPAQTWNDWRFQLKLAVPDARKLKQDNAFWFAADAPVMRVRAARPGERLALFGRSQGSKLLRDVLAEAGVPAWQRASWPVIEADGQILALPPWRRGRGFEAQKGQKALCLTWKAVPGRLAGQP